MSLLAKIEQSPKVGAVGLEKNKPTLDSNSKTSYQKNVFK